MEDLGERIRAFHAGRRWIVAVDAAAGATSTVKRLREWEAAGVMVVAGIEGVGDLPNADAVFYTHTSGRTMMEGIRAYEASIEHPSTELVEAIDAFDPEHEAIVLAGGISRTRLLGGRPFHGAKPPEWTDLEDKTTVDELWDAAGVARAPSLVVPVEEAPGAAARLAGPLGTVWVADNTEGWHGGGEYVRRVHDGDSLAAAVAFFGEHARKVRVMPFLEGIPSSIHGFVTEDAVAVFLPVEMLVFRRSDEGSFLYGRAANFWVPPTRIVDRMRETARSVGAELDRRVDYRGAFGIDGVCTADGFRPTELNPRHSVGIAIQSAAAGLSLGTVDRMYRAGDLEIDAVWLEETIMDAVPAGRSGVSMVPVAGTHTPAEIGVVFDSVARAVGSSDEADATIRVGPSAFGSILVIRFDPERTPVGPSTAPRARAAIDLARGLWGLPVPPITSAPDVCASQH